MVDRIFLKQAGLTFLIAGGTGAVLLLMYAERDVVIGAAVGSLMSVVNAVAGSLSAGYAFDKSQTQFLKVVLGGMMIRMGVLLLVLFVLIKFAGLHVLSLTLSLFIFYLLFLIMEIFSLQRLTEGRSA